MITATTLIMNTIFNALECQSEYFSHCNWSHVNEYFRFDGRMDRCKIDKYARSKLYFSDRLICKFAIHEIKNPSIFHFIIFFVCDYFDIFTFDIVLFSLLILYNIIRLVISLELALFSLRIYPVCEPQFSLRLKLFC